QAIALRPADVSAHLYLAVMLMWQFVPANASTEDNEIARQAETEFEWVLDHDPLNATALGSLASLKYWAAQGVPGMEERLLKLDQVAALYVRLINADPRIKEAYYGLALIDWIKWHQALLDLRTRLHMSPGSLPLPNPAREQLKLEFAGFIEDGVSSLEKALRI